MFFYRAGRDFQLFGDLSDTFLPFLLQHSFGIVALLSFFLFSTFDIEGEADGLPFQYVPEVLIPRNIPT